MSAQSTTTQPASRSSITVVRISSGADPTKAAAQRPETTAVGSSSVESSKQQSQSAKKVDDVLLEKNGRQTDESNPTRTSLFYEVTRRMTRLYCADIMADAGRVNPAAVADLRIIQRTLEENPNKSTLASRLIELGFVELCQHVCQQSFFNSKNFFGDNVALETLSLVLGVVADLTDRTPTACQRVLQIDFHRDLFDVLRHESLDPTRLKVFGEWHCFVADCVMTVLYNVVQSVTEARELYRDQHAVRVFQKFRTNTSDSVSCMSLILQSYVINDDENAILGSDDRSFAFLADELRSSLENTDPPRSNNGYRALEILTAVNKLAVNDTNKAKIVASGALGSYVRLLRADRSVDEQYLAAQGLWTLALSCAERIRKQDGCVEGLLSLLESSDVDGVRRQVWGVLDALGVGAAEVSSLSKSRHIQLPSVPGATAAAAAGSSSSTGSAGTQMMMGSVGQQGSSSSQPIFISYNHASKNTVLRLRDRLKAAGFTVWVDEEGVYESIADDIITGLEQSSVVLVCMTQKYYESPYCKKEVVYAAESYKKIIPLTLEPRYNPHGWLRFHTSDGLRYDFSQDDMFEDSLRRLIVALRKVFVASSANIAADKAKTAAAAAGEASTPTPSTSAGGHQAFLSQAAPEPTGLQAWTSAEVTNWLRNNGLAHVSDWFKGFDGELLLEYKAYRQYSPETLAACVNDERQHGKLALLDVMKLNRAFKRL